MSTDGQKVCECAYSCPFWVPELRFETGHQTVAWSSMSLMARNHAELDGTI
jgi:hypothetical protein